jgi:hypothetical protein
LLTRRDILPLTSGAFNAGTAGSGFYSARVSSAIRAILGIALWLLPE